MIIVIDVDGDLQKNDLEVFVDQLPVDFELTQAQIKIESDLDFGLHQLSITSLTEQRWQILNVKVNDSSLRKLLYLSWSSTRTNPSIQPCQSLWESGMSWTLPFGCPVSHWLSTVETKIPDGEYGKNLAEKYYIWYPDRIKIQGVFPQIVKDFFCHNFDFVAVDKTQIDFKKIPYMQYKHPISNNLIVLAAKDINDNFDTIQKELLPYPGHAENLKDFDWYNDQHEWKNILLKAKGNCRYTSQLPNVWKLIDSLPFPVSYACIGVLPPGAFLYPHMDTTYDYTSTELGCKLLHIPIQWPDGNWLKLAGSSALNLAKTGAVVINNNYFTHSVVNTSDQYRYTLMVRVELSFTDCIIK